MSLGVAIKGPEGVVLAADSRVTLEARQEGGSAIPVNFDNVTKLFGFSKPHDNIGVVTYGVAAIGLRTAHSFIPEFEIDLPKANRLEVLVYAQRLSDFFMDKWSQVMPKDYSGPPMTFIVAGYGPNDPYGNVFVIEIPSAPTPSPRNAGETDFGMTWGGQLEIASRLIFGYDPVLPSALQQELELPPERIEQAFQRISPRLAFRIPYQVLPLQDSVDLAVFMVQTTITAQALAVGVRGVGGPIDVAVVTRTSGLQFVRRKEIRA